MTTVVKRERGVAAGLSRAAVVAAAEEVAARDGLDHLSLRAVAVHLGVSPTAIYHHVTGKDELVDAVADAFATRNLEGRLPDEPIERVRELAHRLHRAGVAQPGLLSALVGRIPDQFPSAHQTFTEELLEALVDSGASEPHAHLLYGMIVRLCLGDVIAGMNVNAPARTPLADRIRALTEQSSLPLTARMMRSQEPNRGQAFDRQLDLILRALPD